MQEHCASDLPRKNGINQTSPLQLALLYSHDKHDLQAVASRGVRALPGSYKSVGIREGIAVP